MSMEKITKRLKIISDLQDEINKIRALVEESLESDSNYQELQDAVTKMKEETKIKKDKVMSTASVKSLQDQLKEIRDDMKDHKTALAQELADYYKESGSLDIVDDDVPLTQAFKLSDQVIGKAVEGISDLITSTGLINVDFADVKTVMKNAGSALMGVGQADGENRAERAANEAINSPLLDVDIKGSTGVLINIVGDSSLTMHEVNKAAKIISDAAHEGANIIFGANIDPAVDGIRVTVIATGFETDFSTIGVVDWTETESAEIIEQIESRYDSEIGVVDTTETLYITETQSDSSDEEDDFDIDKLREEVKKMEEVQEDKPEDNNKADKSEKNDGDKDDGKRSGQGFWSFISSKHST